MVYETELNRLVELYGVWKSYETVAETCKLAGFGAMVQERCVLFRSELRRYAAKRYGNGSSYGRSELSRAMDDVLIRYNQLTIF